MWISGSRVFKSCAARKRFPAVELPSNIQRVGVPIRRGGAPEDCAARRALFRFQMSIQQTSRLSDWTSRLVCTQRPRRAEAFSRHRASVDRPTRRRADSEGRRARRLCRAEGAFSVSNAHIANESALRLDEPARLYSETAPRGSAFPPSSFRRTSNASACRFGGAACPEIVPRGGRFFGFKCPYSKRVGSPVGRAGSSVLRDRAARKRFPAIELPSIVQRVGVPIRRGGVPGDCAARRALFRFQMPI